MRWHYRLLCSILILTLVLNFGIGALGDPYKILGISPRATLQEIRRAYKALAKEW